MNPDLVMCTICREYASTNDGICVNCHEKRLREVAHAHTEQELIQIVQGNLSTFSFYLRTLSRKDIKYNDTVIDVMGKITEIRRLLPE